MRLQNVSSDFTGTALSLPQHSVVEENRPPAVVRIQPEEIIRDAILATLRRMQDSQNKELADAVERCLRKFQKSAHAKELHGTDRPPDPTNGPGKL
jgi:hypothetical protein